MSSASFDATVKVWNAIDGTCLFTLDRHTDAVYSVCFSPNNSFLASGSFDQHIKIWNMSDGSLLKSFGGNVRFLIMKKGWNFSSFLEYSRR